MKLSKPQARQIRKLAALSTELSRSRLLLSALVREKRDDSREALLNLKRAEQRLAALQQAATFVGGPPAYHTNALNESQAKVTVLQELIEEIKTDIVGLEARIESLSLDCTQAARLVERVLAHTGGALHEDFSGGNAVVIGGMGRV